MSVVTSDILNIKYSRMSVITTDRTGNIHACHPELDSGSPLLCGRVYSDLLFCGTSGDAESSSA